MIKREVIETIYEYDKEGKLIKKTVTETHEEDTNITTNTNPSPSWWTYDPSPNYPPYITCNDNKTTHKTTMTASDKTTT